MEANWLAWKERIYPDLKRFAPDQRKAVSRKAGATPFDAIELFGIAAGIVATAMLARYLATEWVGNRRSVTTSLQFLFALPILPFAIAPFHVRRVRRGLRAQIETSQRFASLHQHRNVTR